MKKHVPKDRCAQLGKRARASALNKEPIDPPGLPRCATAFLGGLEMSILPRIEMTPAAQQGIVRAQIGCIDDKRKVIIFLMGSLERMFKQKYYINYIWFAAQSYLQDSRPERKPHETGGGRKNTRHSKKEKSCETPSICR